MRLTTIRPFVALTALSAALLAAAPVKAETMSYKADLKATMEVPPNDSKGTGSVAATYDTATKKLVWTITATSLTGAATAAHFHGPAAATANAPPVVPVVGSLASPMKGEATLTDAQAADLAAGRWYFNIHTAAHAEGEVRGQLLKQ